MSTKTPSTFEKLRNETKHLQAIRSQEASAERYYCPSWQDIFNDDIIIKQLACVSKSYNAMLNDVLAFADGKKDFTPLLYPKFDYESQTNIQQD